MKTLRCGDVGFDCAAVMRAETEEEILKHAAEHAKTVHNLSEISEQAFEKIRAVISDEIPQPQCVASRQTIEEATQMGWPRLWERWATLGENQRK